MSDPAGRRGRGLLSPPDAVRRWWWQLTATELRTTVLAGLAGFAAYELTQEPGFQVHNIDVLVADALLDGRLDIPEPPAYLETVPHDGNHYSPKGPLIALLLVPFVAVWGTGFDQSHLGALLGAGIAAAAWVVAGRIGLGGWRRIGAWALPVFGTTIWYEAKTGALWGVASLGTVLFLLVALAEYFGRRRGWVIGLACGLAMLSRAPAVLALAGFAAAGGFAFDRARVRWAVGLGGGLAAPLVLYASYNLARYGTPMDLSLEILYEIDEYRHARPYGAFSLVYVPDNVWAWLTLRPEVTDAFPWVHPNFVGQSILLTSPAVLVAIGARRERWMWIGAGAVAVPAATFYSLGFAQFGIRYLLDTAPFLFALTCVALRDRPARVYPLLLVVSIAMNAYGVFYTNTYGLSP